MKTRPFWLILSLLLVAASCDQPSPGSTSASLPKLWHTSIRYEDDDAEAVLHEGGFFVTDERRLDAYDANTGVLRWSHSITSGSAGAFANAGRVFTSGWSVHAFDAATGAVLWTHTSATDTTIYTRGTAYEGRVFVGSVYSGAVIALDASTGCLLYTSPSPRD